MSAPAQTEPEPHAVIDHRVAVKGGRCGSTWLATRSDCDDWEGSDVQYRDICAAFPLVLAQYVYDEYGYEAGVDPLDEAPDATYAWRCARGVWRLYENNEDTGVRLHQIEVIGL